jgi:hypothetical protein
MLRAMTLKIEEQRLAEALKVLSCSPPLRE